MNRSALRTRFAEPVVAESIADTPVTLIHGPRQCGKTTLARMVGEPRGYSYLSFDSDDTLAQARYDPTGFALDLPRRVILDEVQRVPGLFNALKLVIDRDRMPGRFILTGSTNVLLVPELGDSLAGRMELVRLHPFSQGEIGGRDASPFLDALFSGRFRIHKYERLAAILAERITAGGFPAALERRPGPRRAAWYRNYIDLLIQRDVRDLARLHYLDDLPKLLEVAAAQSAQLSNLSRIASTFQASRNTVRAYLTLLERLFLIDVLRPWHSNRGKRLVKAPKIHMVDSGVACALLGVNARGLLSNRKLLGSLFESFVFQELRRQAASRSEPLRFYHFRDRDGYEVDVVIERGGLAVAGIETKAAASVRASDFRGLRKLKAIAGDRFVGGVVLYDGETSLPAGDGFYAVPIRALWEGFPSSAG